MAAIAGAVVAGLLVYQLVLVQREYFTGTNSTAARSIAAVVEPGSPICATGLLVPAGTQRVRLEAKPLGAAARISLEGRRAASRPLPLRPGRQRVDVPLAAGGARRLCIRSLGAPLAVYGAGGSPSLWYLPRAGERRSLLASLPDAFERAALFRPGFVGPWTYLLVVLALPALAYSAVRLLARSGDGARGSVPVGLAIAALAFLHAAAWSLITPPFDAPDEQDHYAYAQHLAETGTAPCQACSKPERSSEERLALRAVRVAAYRESAAGRPPWLAADERRWRERDDSLQPSPDDGGGPTTAASHSPPYYGLMTSAYGVGDSIFDRLAAMRLLSALLGAVTAALAYLVVRELLPTRRHAAVLAGLVVAFQPMFAFVSGAVNNDNGVNAVLALLAYLLVRALRRGLSPTLAAGIGAALVLAPLTKLTGYAALAPALVALVVLARRQHGRSDLPAWLALFVTVLGLELLWWRLSGSFDRTIYATPDGRSFESQPVLTNLVEDPLGYLSYLVQVFVPDGSGWPAFETYVERGFAAFGWVAVTFPLWVYVAIAVALAATAALALRALWANPDAARCRLPEIAVLAALALAVIAGVHLAFFGLSGEERAIGEQGRYAFPAIPAWAAVVAAASLGLGRERAPALAAALLTGFLGLSLGSVLLALGGFYV